MKLTVLFVMILWQFVTASVGDNSTSEAPQHPKPDVYELHVITDIKYRYATTTVTSRVVNPADVAQEVGFTVVLPESAFISGFLMEIKDKVYEAYVKEKEEAKKDYDAAVSQGLGAGYVEQKARDSNQFTVSVNIEPHSKVNFNLSYDQLLTRTLGTYKHVVNINPGQIVRDMSVVVNINESSKITKVEVPELQQDNEVSTDPGKKQNALAVITRPDPNSATISWAPTPKQQEEIAKDGVNGQLTVEYDVDRENSQQILVEDGYFVHFFAPEALKPLPKHVVFVLDYSGSMIGKKIEQLKEAMATILADLSSQDFFSVVIFSDMAQAWLPVENKDNTTETTTTPLPFNYNFNTPVKDPEVTKDHIVPATPDKLLLAKDHINTFSDYGGTNIIAALRTGLKLAALGEEVLKNTAQQPKPMIIFLTDGEPNVETYDTEEIVKKVKELNTQDVTIFSLAFGYGADVKFLKKLSYGNDGFHRVIYEAADAAAQLKNFYKEIASPLLSNITFNYVPSQIDQDSATRVDFPTFFNGSEIVVAGKLQSQEKPSETKTSGELLAKGVEGYTSYPIIIDFDPLPPPHQVTNRSISRLEKVWAYLTIQQLLDKFDSLSESAEKNETRDKALDLGLKYKFVTPLTSLVVVKPNETTSVGAEQVRPGFAGAMGAPSPLGSGFLAQPPLLPQHMLSGAGYGGIAGQSGYPSSMAPSPTYSGQKYSTTFARPAVTESISPDKTDVPERGTLEDLPWLFNYTTNNVTFTLPLDGGSADFLLGHNETDTVFGSCNLPNGGVGECRHLEHCVLSVFSVGIDAFLPYRCDTNPSKHLGACCPMSVDSTTPTPDLSTPVTN